VWRCTDTASTSPRSSARPPFFCWHETRVT
jgi:hypothetical protein